MINKKIRFLSKNFIFNLLKKTNQFFFFKKLRKIDEKSGQQLSLVQDNLNKIASNDILLFACLRNEKTRMPFFVEYYRNLGVKHFIFVDNNSNDGFMDWARKESDVSVWHTAASYKNSKFGMLWLNDLLRRYGVGHWNVVVDPDEFLVYPYMETRSLKALAAFLEEERRHCMHAVMLDTYSDRALKDTVLHEGENPFEVCPYFDRDGYVQTESWGGSTWIRGGVRLRVHFSKNPGAAPALNKIPFIKWKENYHYNMSMHDIRPLMLNRAHSPNEVSTTGALFHFKMVASLAAKAQEEMNRKEHYAGGREYERYHATRVESFYEPGVSVKYQSVKQLIELGIMSPGRWF